ncbi:hypothetical protein D3C73_768140 [compost metagenome]
MSEGGTNHASERRRKFLENRRTNRSGGTRSGNDTGSGSGSGSGSVDKSQASRSVGISGSTNHAATINVAATGTSSADEGIIQSGRSVTNGLSGHPDESARERRNRLRRERYAKQRIDSGYVVNSKRSSTDDAESDEDISPRSEGSSIEGEFQISSEVPILDAPTGADKKKEQTIKPRRTRKNKEPDKGTVSIVASSMQDIYEVLDGIAMIATQMTGREYPDGLMSLDEKKAQKMAYALTQMNDALPRVAQKINQVSAPLSFTSVLITDLAVKGAMLYGIFKQQPNK